MHPITHLTGHLAEELRHWLHDHFAAEAGEFHVVVGPEQITVHHPVGEHQEHDPEEPLPEQHH
jgi:hypothetical protein